MIIDMLTCSVWTVEWKFSTSRVKQLNKLHFVYFSSPVMGFRRLIAHSNNSTDFIVFAETLPCGPFRDTVKFIQRDVNSMQVPRTQRTSRGYPPHFFPMIGLKVLTDMEIPILLIGINGRYKKKLKGKCMCQPEQCKRYVSMANRTICKKST